MAWLLYPLACLTIIFGFSLSLYPILYRWRVPSRLFRSLLFLFLGTALTVVVGVLLIIFLWPPPPWEYF